MKKFFGSPDKELIFFKRLFAMNNRLLQIISFLAFALLIYDIGFKSNPQEGLIHKTCSYLLIFLALGYTIRMFSKSERYSLLRYFVEILIDKPNIFGVKSKTKKVIGVLTPETIIEKDDIMLLFGHIKDLQSILSLED